jgi:hypothetical protein
MVAIGHNQSREKGKDKDQNKHLTILIVLRGEVLEVVAF